MVERNRKNGALGGRPKKLENFTKEELQQRIATMADAPKPIKKTKKKHPKPYATSFLKEEYPSISYSSVYSFSEPMSIPKDYPLGYTYNAPKNPD